MVTVLGGDAASGLQYKHRLGDGPCDMSSGYGIIMAEAAGLPREVVLDARAIQHVVRLAFPSLLPCQRVYINPPKTNKQTNKYYVSI